MNSNSNSVYSETTHFPQGIKIAFALTGSYCTFSTAIAQMKKLIELKAEIIPIMSENAYSTDTRFGLAGIFRKQIEEICGRKIIHTIRDAEPIGPKKMAEPTFEKNHHVEKSSNNADLRTGYF